MTSASMTSDRPHHFPHYRRSRLDAIWRRFVPSVSSLTYNRFFQIVVNTLSGMAGLLIPEYRKLPPAHLRARVGTGNRIIFNHANYLSTAIWFWFDSLSRGLVNLSSAVVEIGCGCGKTFQHLHNTGEFTGTFTGIDIDEEMLRWCRKSYTRPGFQFVQSPHSSKAYGAQSNDQTPASFWRIPIADDTVSFVYSCSLLTHLLETEMENYLSESFRILKDGGALRMSFFCIETVEMGVRWTFSHRIGNAWVENLKIPEAAVAYSQKTMTDYCRKAGFDQIEYRLSPIQSEIICKKPVASVSGN